MNTGKKAVFSLVICLFCHSNSSLALEIQDPSATPIEHSVEDLIAARSVSIRAIHVDEDGTPDQFVSGMGVLLNEKWVLTAGHILEKMDQGHVFIKSEMIPIKSFHFFAGAHNATGDQDLALIELQSKVPLNLPLEVSTLKSHSGPFYVSGYDSEEFEQRDSEDSLNRDLEMKIGVVSHLFDQPPILNQSPNPNYKGLLMSFKCSSILPESQFSNCSLEEGDSGGGLFNSKAELVGISARIATLDLMDPELPNDSDQNSYALKVSSWIPINDIQKQWIETTIQGH